MCIYPPYPLPAVGIYSHLPWWLRSGNDDGRTGGECGHPGVCVGWGCRGHSLIHRAHPCQGPLAPSFLPTLQGCGNRELETGNSNLTPPPLPVTFSGITTIDLIYPKMTVPICRGRTHRQVQTHRLPLCTLCLAQCQGVLVTCNHHSVYSKDRIFRIKDRTAR